MIKKLKDLQTIHVRDYFRLFLKSKINFSFIVTTKSINVMSKQKINLSDLLDDYIRIEIIHSSQEEVEVLEKTINLKVKNLNGVQINSNLLIPLYSVQSISIDNKIIYIGNITNEIEEKINLQQTFNKIEDLRGKLISS